VAVAMLVVLVVPMGFIRRLLQGETA